MADIFKFDREKENNNEQLEEHVCPTCELIEDTMELVLELADSKDEVAEYIINAINSARKIGYDHAMKEIVGYSLYSMEHEDMDDH